MYSNSSFSRIFWRGCYHLYIQNQSSFQFQLDIFWVCFLAYIVFCIFLYSYIFSLDKGNSDRLFSLFFYLNIFPNVFIAHLSYSHPFSHWVLFYPFLLLPYSQLCFMYLTVKMLFNSEVYKFTFQMLKNCTPKVTVQVTPEH